LATLFRENGIDYDKVNYFSEPFTEKNLGALIKKTGRRPFELLRKGSDARFAAGTPDADVIKAMVADPNLIQRPIVEFGERAVVARPIEKALELLETRSG
jgi:arsenate reductase